jgi:hypothetical protein
LNWYPIEALEPGKLVVLHFRDETAPQCVGYVEQDGVCGWPEKVTGRRPDGWLDLSSMFAGMTTEIRRAAAATL